MGVKRRTQVMLEEEQVRRLRTVAEAEDKSVSRLVREAVDCLLEGREPLPATEDPIWDIVGLGGDRQPLIDGIPVSEDPNLYYLADLMERKGVGPYAEEREEPPHAWEIAPQRYRRGRGGEPARVAGDNG
ncbi:MAG: hypothetical protein E3J64_01950 [Anaerolineales bacterium]|nr:MAG: hypothetical protein E3J64_01950 [Anaerolineales bacterium]